MTDGTLSRRKLLERSLQIPLGGMLLAATATVQKAQAAAVCVDLSKIPDDKKVIREAMKYVKKSADPAKSCGNCVFYKPAGGGCGTCELFEGGPAEVAGGCEAWAPKAAAK